MPHGIAAGHQPEAVVLDLVNPIGAGRGLVGWGLGRGHEPAPVVPACASVRLPSRAEPRRPSRRSSHWWHAASDRDGHIRP
jgi:hypothetical protein